MTIWENSVITRRFFHEFIARRPLFQWQDNNIRKEKRSSSKAKSLSLRLDADGFEFGLLARLAPPFLH